MSSEISLAEDIFYFHLFLDISFMNLAENDQF